MPNEKWKIDYNDKAEAIDCESDNEQINAVYSQWSDLPDLLLEEIFSYLNVRDRYWASMVCRNWYTGFYMPRVWNDFTVDDRTLTRAKFNYYSGWQYVLDHLRTQSCLHRIGPVIRGLDFRPVYSFNNLFQFMTLWAWCMEQAKMETCTKEVKNIGCRINKLTYVFPCNMASTDDPEGVKLFGTGGQLLGALKRLLANLCQLKSLKLIDLMLERYEAKHLLDEVLNSCCFVLKTLHLINVTNLHCPIMHIGLFLNLQVLVISPQNIDDDVLLLLADSKVTNLHLLQNRYTPNSIAISPCNAKAWRIVRRDNPTLKVHLRVESTGKRDILLQPDAPVSSIIYQCPKLQITSDGFLQILDMYKTTLASYGHALLPRFHSSKSFDCRVDSLLVLMARQVPNLTNLIIRDKISTCTILLIAKIAPNLRQFAVRRNGVILKCDWPRNPEWDDEYYKWLKCASKSYAATELEVSKILGYHWAMLSDKLFKKIDVNVRSV